MRRSAAIVGVVFVSLAVPFIAAQAPVPPAGTEYSPADIAFGAKVYAAQCSTCHLPTGDGVGGVDLRSGKFRSATTDQQLANVILNGLPGTGMNGFRNFSSA
jgi:mono/diheme cytochrome c family protein